MTWQMGSFGVSVLVLVLQAWNLYITTSIKLWAVEKFVAKSDTNWGHDRFVSKTDYLESLHQWAKAELNKDAS